RLSAMGGGESVGRQRGDRNRAARSTLSRGAGCGIAQASANSPGLEPPLGIDARMPTAAPLSRPVPARIADRLIVALDLPTVDEARAMSARLDGLVSFFKLGLWLTFAAGFDRLLDELAGRGKQVVRHAK